MASVVEVQIERQLGDGDVLKISSVGLLSAADVLELHRLAGQIKRYALDRGLRVLEVRIGPGASLDDGA